MVTKRAFWWTCSAFCINQWKSFVSSFLSFSLKRKKKSKHSNQTSCPSRIKEDKVLLSKVPFGVWRHSSSLQSPLFIQTVCLYEACCCAGVDTLSVCGTLFARLQKPFLWIIFVKTRTMRLKEPLHLKTAVDSSASDLRTLQSLQWFYRQRLRGQRRTCGVRRACKRSPTRTAELYCRMFFLCDQP